MRITDTLRFDLLDHIMLIVHADVAPDAEDWARMILVRDANRHRIRGTLVVAPPRASINGQQRADVARFMRGSGASIAVVTESALVRGVARAVGFLGVQVRAFEPNELAAALDYLVVQPSRHLEITKRIDALRTQLAATPRIAV